MIDIAEAEVEELATSNSKDQQQGDFDHRFDVRFDCSNKTSGENAMFQAPASLSSTHDPIRYWLLLLHRGFEMRA